MYHVNMDNTYNKEVNRQFNPPKQDIRLDST
jgi:hypothetical protein